MSSSGAPTSRRRIREAVVQFLYATEPSGEDSAAADEPVFELLLEPLREKSTRARARAILHLQQGREQATAGLPQLVHQLASIEPADEADDLGKALRELNEGEEDIAAALNYLRHELNGNKSAERLREGLQEAGRANLRSRTAAGRLRASDPTFPALQKVRENALEIWENTSPLAARLELALAAQPGSQPELRPVVKADARVEQVATRIRTYLAGLRTHLPTIDRELAAVVQNYAPDRIDRVDRAILRLAAYELLFDPEVPRGVAIDEAVELAKTFGTSNSPRFINGVLDQLAKTQCPDRRE